MENKKHIRLAGYFGQNLRRLCLLEVGLLAIVVVQFALAAGLGLCLFPSRKEFLGYLQGDFLYKDYLGLVTGNCVCFGVLTFAMSYFLNRREFLNQKVLYREVLRNEIGLSKHEKQRIQRKFLTPHIVYFSGLNQQIKKSEFEEELREFIDFGRDNDSLSSENGSLILGEEDANREKYGNFTEGFKGARDLLGRAQPIDYNESVDRMFMVSHAEQPQSTRGSRILEGKSETNQSIHTVSIRRAILGPEKQSFNSGAFNDSDIINIPKECNLERLMNYTNKKLSVLFLPDVQKLCEVKREMVELIEAHKHHNSRKGCGLLLLKTEKHENEFRKKLTFLRDKYQKFMKKVKFSGKALVYFRNLEDVSCLYEMNRLSKRFMRNLKFLGKSPRVFRSQVAVSRKSFLIDNKDFLFHNMKVAHQKKYFTKVVLYTLIVVIFLFVSTPNAILQSVTELMKKDKLKRLGWTMDPRHAKVWSDVWMSLVPMITLGINALLLILLDFFAYWQHYSTHSACQKFIFRYSFCYMLINMLIIPGLSLSTANSIFRAVEKRDFKLMTLLNSLKDKENDSFFSTLIIQSGIVGFLINLFLVSDLPNNRFVLGLTLSRRERINNGDFHQRTSARPKSRPSSTATTTPATAWSSSSWPSSAPTSRCSTPRPCSTSSSASRGTSSSFPRTTRTSSIRAGNSFLAS